MKNNILLTIFLTLGVAFTVSAHKGHDHPKTDTAKVDTANVETGTHAEMPAGTEHHQEEEMTAHHEQVMGKAPFSDFPTLHPLVVHFPIVLLILAVLTQFLGLFVLRKPLSWVTLALVALGFLGAWVAAGFVHPHTEQLTEYAAWALQQHEKYADITLWTALAALVLKTVSHFFLNMKIWAEVVIFLVLGVSAYAVSSAGHFGAQLTHIEGVGPQGHFLEMESEQHSH
ncbi:MAG: hypothetical protein GXO83_00390 [Chlorobi bacterium]|nr:hypothetical protein [Chlorobiota bacterium]